MEGTGTGMKNFHEFNTSDHCVVLVRDLGIPGEPQVFRPLSVGGTEA